MGFVDGPCTINMCGFQNDLAGGNGLMRFGCLVRNWCMETGGSPACRFSVAGHGGVSLFTNASQ